MAIKNATTSRVVENMRYAPENQLHQVPPLTPRSKKYPMHGIYFLASCAIDNGGCERLCENTPSGIRCLCPSGFYLSKEDNKTCIGKHIWLYII